jgi:hypothetical protein
MQWDNHYTVQQGSDDALAFRARNVPILFYGFGIFAEVDDKPFEIIVKIKIADTNDYGPYTFDSETSPAYEGFHEFDFRDYGIEPFPVEKDKYIDIGFQPKNGPMTFGQIGRRGDVEGQPSHHFNPCGAYWGSTYTNEDKGNFPFIMY